MTVKVQFKLFSQSQS